MFEPVKKFLAHDSAGGIVLIMATVAAVILANSPLSVYYQHFTNMPVEFRIGPLEIAKPLFLWVNDGLMAIFFLCIGLELKREILEGQLSDPRNILLPMIGALGGMIVPAIIYLLLTAKHPEAIRGWAIPVATDIAFSLGILSLLGNRVPISLRLFLVSLAIFDDAGAILIIALFYSSDLSLSALWVVAACLLILTLFNRQGVSEIATYVLVGGIMWIAMLKSGIHATLSGVLLALFVPLKLPHKPEWSPLKEFEHDLTRAVIFGILPLFAFVNSGISLSGINADYVFHAVPIGIASGLFLGKQAGVFGFCWLGIRTRIVSLPHESSMAHLYGVSILCGVGFTMSLFIGSLAFEPQNTQGFFDERLGIIAGSFLSAVAGYFVLHKKLPKPKETT